MHISDLLLLILIPRLSAKIQFFVKKADVRKAKTFQKLFRNQRFPTFHLTFHNKAGLHVENF